MALDHGLLNLPLHKRGINIDREIDAYKAQVASAQKQARKSASQQTAEDRTTAKAMFAALTDERIAELATKAKQTPKAVREFLKRESHWQPTLVIKILSEAA